MQKALVRILSILFPQLMVRFAYKSLTNPRIIKLRDHEMIVLDKAQKEKLSFKGFDIQLYQWGNGSKKVLLVHGWEGQAGNFSDLIEQMLKEDFSVFAFDGPSHGFSSKRATSLFEFSELVAVLVRKFEVDHIVSHSFGGVATVFGLYSERDLSVEKYVMLTTPEKFRDRIRDVSNQVGITEKVERKLIEKLEAESLLDTTQMNVSSYVKDVNVQEALIIHDKNDKVIPIHQSRNVHENWSQSQFFEIEGTGHFRILRTDFVIEKAIRFLLEPSS